MQKQISNVWISSIDHLDAVSSLAKKNPWWKYLLGLNKVPADFPYVKNLQRKYPIVFYSERSLTLFERQLEYKANTYDSPNKNIYFNLKGDLNFEFAYDTLKVTRFKHPQPFLKAFNISWIKLTLSNNYGFENILLSSGGSGMNLNQVTQTNDEIFEFLKNKINSEK